MKPGSVTTTPVHGRARRPRVLVVDDEAAIRMICAENLRLDGYTVIEASNGQEALELALEAAPDLMLIDISMPVLDGFGLARALGADERTRHVPLVFLTGERDPGTEARVFEAGGIGYFPKPFDPAAIGTFIQGVLARNAPAGAGHAVQSKRSRSASVGA